MRLVGLVLVALTLLMAPALGQPQVPARTARVGLLAATSYPARVEGFRNALGLECPPSLLQRADRGVQ